jgi:hypothetical protein
MIIFFEGEKIDLSQKEHKKMKKPQIKGGLSKISGFFIQYCNVLISKMVSILIVFST